MEIKNNRIYLEDGKGFSPIVNSINYTDLSENKISIPIKLVVRLYEECKDVFEKRGVNWEEYCNNLFKENMAQGGLIEPNNSENVFVMAQPGTIYVNKDIYKKYSTELLNKLNGTKNAEIITYEEE